MLRTLLLSLLLVGFMGCSDEKSDKKSEQAATIDLSSAEATGATILTALKSGDKETFRKCLSTKLQEKAKACEGKEDEQCKKRYSLDAMFNTWKNGVEKQKLTPKTFNQFQSLKNFDGKWRLKDV